MRERTIGPVLGDYGIPKPGEYECRCAGCTNRRTGLGRSQGAAHHSLKLLGWGRRHCADPGGLKTRRWFCAACIECGESLMSERPLDPARQGVSQDPRYPVRRRDARYRLEFYPTVTPRPAAIWDETEGGGWRRLVVVFRGTEATMEEARKMVAALNEGEA